MTLLERDDLLAQLDARWTQARKGPGQLVFIEGEAGIGKTTVLRAFAASVRAHAPVYWGACEAMATPRPLGALDDIAIDSGGKLAIPHDGSGERHRLFVAFVELLAERPALAIALRMRAESVAQTGDRQAALRDGQASVQIAQQLQGGRRYSLLTGQSLLLLARVMREDGDLPGARAAALSAAEHLAAMLGDAHRDTQLARRLASG